MSLSPSNAPKLVTHDQLYDLLTELIEIALADLPEHLRSAKRLNLEWARGGLVEALDKYGHVYLGKITYSLVEGSQPQ